MYRQTEAVVVLQRASAEAGVLFSEEQLWATEGHVTLKYGPNVRMSSNPKVAALIDEANRLVFGAPLRVGAVAAVAGKAVRA